MKNLTLTIITAISIFLNCVAASEDVTIAILDSSIIQIQDGSNLEQEATIGFVESELKVRVNIIITNSSIIQTQRGNNSAQKARIGTVSCSCRPQR